MHWFYVEHSQIAKDSITITGPDVNHIKNVLRMEPGERVVLCDGQGVDYYCTLASLEEKQVVAKIEEMNASQSELPAKIFLFQGIPKKDKMELIIQKTVELGIFQIIPVAARRCVAKMEDKKKEEKKRERWQSIAQSAAKQSGRGIIPKIGTAMNFQEAVAFARELEETIIPYEQAKGMEYTWETMEKACGGKSIGIFIGPEGGFDPCEIQIAREAGFHVVTLGERILRTETAGFTILSVLMLILEKNRQNGR